MKRLFLLITLSLLASNAFAQTPLNPVHYTVATLPAASTLTNKVVNVTDGLTKGDCTIGGGVVKNACISDGASWLNWGGDGTGAGGTLTDVNATTPVNSSHGTTPTISIDNAKADGSTKGALAGNANDFNDDGAGVFSIDYTNGQSADASHKGFLPAADFVTFNAKLTSTLADGKIFVGNGSSVATPVTPSGDITITNAGVTAIGAGKVISSMLNITTSTCTNQFISAISATGIGTCRSVVNADITNSTIDLTAKVTGVLPSANGGTGVNNAGTITNANNTTITGGGTLALGGFTFTVPGTGTGVLTSRTITEGAGLAGNTYDLSANRTLALGTPSTLAVSTSNSASGTTHTHAITSNSNPGAAASLLASNSSGGLTLVDIMATSSLFVRDSSTGLYSPSTTVVSLQLNNRLQSNGYTSQTTGFAADGATGAGDFRYLFTDELHAKAFIADIETALAGGQRISKSVSKVITTFTLPTAGNNTLVDVEEFAGSTAHVFVDGDLVEFRQTTRASDTSLSIASAYGTAVYASRTAASGTSPAFQTYTFFRPASNGGSASGSINAGTLVLDYGGSANKFGYWEVNAVDGANAANSPYAQIVTASGSGGPAVQANRTVRTRMGNLNGITGVTEFGLYAGNVVDGTTLASTHRYIRLTDSNFELNNLDLNIYNSGNKVIALDYATPYFSLGATAPTSYLQTSSNGIWMGNGGSSVYKMRVGSVSSGGALTAGFTWDGTTFTVIGGITSTTGAIGGFNIGADYVRDAGNSFGLASTVTGGDDVRFWAGDTFANRATAPFNVTEAGVVTMTSGAIAGKLLMSGSGSAIAIGSTPPTSASAGTGLWLDRTGLYSLNTNVVKASITNLGVSAGAVRLSDGGLTTTGGSATITIDSTGLRAESASASTLDGFVLSGVLSGSSYFSPRLRFTGNYFRTANLSDNEISFMQEVRPSTAGTGGASSVDQVWVLSYSIGTVGGSGTYTDGIALNAKNGYVGIGTIAPNATLDVRGDIFTTGSIGATGSRVVKGWFTDLQVTNAIAASITGSAPTLTTPRAINGVNFDGSAAITVTAAAGTLTGATLNSGVTASSLTSVGTLTTLGIGAAPDSKFQVTGANTGFRIGYVDGNDNYIDAVGSTYFRNNSGTVRATFLGSGGLTVGSPTGGDKGVGAINAQAVYDDNVLLTDWAFDLHYDGRVRDNDPFYRGQSLYSLDETRSFTEKNRRLPWMPSRESFESDRSLGGMTTRLWQGQEQQQLYVFGLEDRIKSLEAKVADLEKRKN